MPKLSQVIVSLTESIAKLPEAIAAGFVSRVSARTPVLSGALQAGWTAEITTNQIVIKNPVEYASYVEFGTEKMAPRGMLRATMLESNAIVAEAVAKVSK